MPSTVARRRVVIPVPIATPSPAGPSGTFGVSVSGNGLVDGSGNALILRGLNISGPEYQPGQQGHIYETGFKSNLSAYWPCANVLRIPVCAYAWLDGAVPPLTSITPSGQTSASYLPAAQAAPPSPYVANPGFYPNPPGQASFHHLPNGSTAPNFATCFGAAYRSTITSLINLCASKGIYCVLDLHWTDPFVQPGWSTAAGNMSANGQGNMPDYFTQCFWDHASAAFASSPWVIFEMMNEPWSSNVAQAATATVVQQSYSPGAGEWGIYANGGLCLMIPSRGSWGSAQNQNVTSGTGYNTAAASGGIVSISSVSVAAGTATVTCSVNHGLVVGQPTMILGCTTTGFNGIATVTGVPSLTQFQVATGLGSVTPGAAAWSVACFQSVGFQTILNTIRASGATNVVIMPGLKAEGELSGLTHVAYGSLPITDSAHQLAIGIHLYSIPGGSLAGLISDTTADTNGNYPLLCTEMPGTANGVYATNNGLTYPPVDASQGIPFYWMAFVSGHRPNASSIPWAFSLSNAAGGSQACITSQATGNPTCGFPAWPVTGVAGNVLTIPKAVGFLSIGDSVTVWLGGNTTPPATNFQAADTIANISGSNFTLTNSGSINYSTATYMGTATVLTFGDGASGWMWEQWMIDTYGGVP